MRHRPDLIVPIRDRRQHKRYLTLRNVLLVLLTLFVAFVAINVWSEIRPRVSHGYGHLFDHALPAVEQKPVEVVREEAPPPEPAAQAVPMQIVDDVGVAPAIAPPTAPSWTVENRQLAGAAPGSDAPVTIVGGPEGVTIVRTARRKPVLSGGFGR